MLILGLLGMYFDAAVVFVTSQTLLLRLAVAILWRYEVSLESEGYYNQDVSSEIISTHYVALSKILYSAGGFQDFLNSVKNAVLMPENAKKIIKKLATRWSHVLGPILIDYLTSTYLLIYLSFNILESFIGEFHSFRCNVYVSLTFSNS